MKIKESKLKDIAKAIREDILKMTTEAGSGHPGGSLSATDIITTLYFYKMKYDPKKPEWEACSSSIIFCISTCRLFSGKRIA